MRNFLSRLSRERVGNFSRGSYETAFSVFMIVIAYFYRHNPQIVYPQILYCFLLLMASNFVFNRLLRDRSTVSLLVVDAVLLFNIWVITGVLYYSGRGGSYFWVLYLLPIFASALLASFRDVMAVLFLCSLAVVLLAWPVDIRDLVGIMSLVVKLSVFGLSAAVVYRTAESRKTAECRLASKRQEAEKLAGELSRRDTEMVVRASIVELGEVAGGVMHDLANSVSVILMSAQIAVEDEKPEKKDLELIIVAARFAKSVISSALDITRSREYVFEPGGIRGPLEDALLLLACAVKKKQTSVRIDLPEDLPPVRMSRVHISRVFVNIVSNSLSFAPERGVITVSAARAGNFVELEIADSGPGFPESLLKSGIKAFGTTRKEAGGTGLGLYVCAQVVEKHGGEFGIANAPAGGAVVRIKLSAADRTPSASVLRSAGRPAGE